jgi:uncharacterized OsmC-like protein
MTVVAELIEGFHIRTETLDTGHVFFGDEPEDIGGENKGPSPFAFFKTSLAN